MIIKLNSTHHNKVMEYLKREPEFNLLTIWDIEKYGYDNHFLNIWSDINKKGEIEGILLKYFEFLIFYSHKKYDREGFCDLISNIKYLEISGKTDSLENISKKLQLKKQRLVKLCKLEDGNLLRNYNMNTETRKIKFRNINKIVKLYELIDEFDNTTVEGVRNGLKTGRGYCIEMDKKVVSMAKSTSESKTHAMIVGVGTHPEYRNKGLATKCIVKICSELLKEGKTPCLFYDNKEAGKIYIKLGFKEVGNWSIYYK